MLRALTASLLFASLIAAGSARAAGPSPEVMALGKTEFDRGVALLHDARYADAAAALERSVAAFESPSALYNLGLAYRGLGAYRRAIATLERFLVIAGAQHEQLRTGAQRILPELRAGLVHLTLVVRGAPEAVSLDGEALALPTPGAPELELEVVVDPGPHQVEVTRRGFEPVREVVGPLQAGEHRRAVIEGARQRIFAELVVEPDVTAAIVRVDGVVRGAGPAKLTLEPGVHLVEVEAEGYLPSSQRVSLEPAARERLAVGLVRASSSVFGAWWFWTGVAVVVGAAAAGAVVLAQPDDPAYDGGTFGVTLQN